MKQKAKGGILFYYSILFCIIKNVNMFKRISRAIFCACLWSIYHRTPLKGEIIHLKRTKTRFVTFLSDILFPFSPF